jgi:hypothetical protein
VNIYPLPVLLSLYLLVVFLISFHGFVRKCTASAKMDIEMGKRPSAPPASYVVVAQLVPEDSHIPTADGTEVENESYGLISEQDSCPDSRALISRVCQGFANCLSRITCQGSWPSLPSCPCGNCFPANVEDWNVSWEQFSAGYVGNVAILMIMLFVQEDGIFAQIVSVGSVSVLFILIQKYFGYVLQCSDGSSVCCNIPLPQFKKIAFPTDRSVSFSRWLNGILMWITEVFLLLPKTSYQYLEANANFPDHRVVVVIFLVQLLISFGTYSCLHDSLINRN